MAPDPLSESEQLFELGLTSEFDRTNSFWEHFSLSFTYLSPVVGLYSVFAMEIRTGGFANALEKTAFATRQPPNIK